MILAGDVGGTKTLLGLFEASGSALRLVRDATFASAEHTSLEELLSAFLQPAQPVALAAACIGVAGPVIDGECHLTNLNWHFSETTLATAANAPRLRLLNDLEATAYGALYLPPEELAVLNPGVDPPRRGNVAVIAAGTGLGEAMLFWDGTRYHPIASEGGHCAFAPSSENEIALLRYLREKFGGHVSFERVLSGPGLHNIYEFLRRSGNTSEPAWLTARIASEDPSAAISAAGLSGRDPVCVAALELLSSLYGTEAANLVLKCLAVGGVFVAGGIAPKILPVLQNGSFMRGFMATGRFSDFMKRVPVRVSLNPRAALLGAAYFALHLQDG